MWTTIGTKIMGLFGGWKPWAVVGAVLVSLLAWGWITGLVEDNAALEIQRDTAIEMHDREVRENVRLREKVRTINALVEDLGKSLTATRTAAELATRVLEDHDLGRITRAKPGLVQRRARDATERVLQELEREINTPPGAAPGGDLSGAAAGRSGEPAAPPADGPDR